MDERVRTALVVAYVVGLGLSITLSETALALLAVNVVAFATLWMLNMVRLARFRDRMVADLLNHGRAVGFFTMVAGTCVLGSQAFISGLKQTGQLLDGAIVLECVGYASRDAGSQRTPPGVPIAVPTVGNFLGIVGNEASRDLVAAVEDLSAGGGPLPAVGEVGRGRLPHDGVGFLPVRPVPQRPGGQAGRR